MYEIVQKYLSFVVSIIFVIKHNDLIASLPIKVDVSIKNYCISFVMFVTKTGRSIAYFVK